MSALRTRAKALESNANPNPDMENTPKISLYEQTREERIQENLQRMQSLGILDLSLKLKSQARPEKRVFHSSESGRKWTRDTPPMQPSGPLRRSSRLQNVTPVSYSEAVAAKKERPFEEEGIELEGGSKPELYTEKHEKLLGNTERSWEFFVDGYGKDGKRIYDPIRGKTCHQCRQKTMGHRTHCSQCNLVQGQFCGDCLYMRYGEHVLEALENDKWICPVCRGICNCSLCRTNKGWLPTGTIYRKIAKLGYKSVAHYLIETERSQASSEGKPDTTCQASAKRSLSFPKTEARSEELFKVTDNKFPGMLKLQDKDSEDNVKDDDDDGSQCENDNKIEKTLNSTRRSLPFSHSDNKEAYMVDLEVQDDLKLSEPQCEEDRGEDGFRGEKDKQLNLADKENQDNGLGSESCQETRRKRKLSIEPNPDSIAGRLRQRRGKGMAPLLMKS